MDFIRFFFFVASKVILFNIVASHTCAVTILFSFSITICNILTPQYLIYHFIISGLKAGASRNHFDNYPLIRKFSHFQIIKFLCIQPEKFFFFFFFKSFHVFFQQAFPLHVNACN